MSRSLIEWALGSVGSAMGLDGLPTAIYFNGGRRMAVPQGCVRHAPAPHHSSIDPPHALETEEANCRGKMRPSDVGIPGPLVERAPALPLMYRATPFTGTLLLRGRFANHATPNHSLFFCWSG
jgi:hypothetical protein